jgi:hypothetical protein
MMVWSNRELKFDGKPLQAGMGGNRCRNDAG